MDRIAHPLILALAPPHRVDATRDRPPSTHDPIRLPREINRMARRFLWLDELIYTNVADLLDVGEDPLREEPLLTLCVCINGFVLGQSILVLQRSFPAPELLEPVLLWAARLCAAVVSGPLALLVLQLAFVVIMIILEHILHIVKDPWVCIVEAIFGRVVQRLGKESHESVELQQDTQRVE